MLYHFHLEKLSIESNGSAVGRDRRFGKPEWAAEYNGCERAVGPDATVSRLHMLALVAM